MTYTVKHFYSNPHNNADVECETKEDGIGELESMVSDENGGCSKLLNSEGKCIAFKNWDEQGITWM